MTLTPDVLKIDRTVAGREDPAIQALRKELGGQQKAEQRRQTEAEFGLSFNRAELEHRIRAALPPIPRAQRRLRWTLEWISLPHYTGTLPGTALERVQSAIQSGGFGALKEQREGLFGGSYECSAFQVIEARLADQEADPWLVAQLKDVERYIVLAYWD